MKWAMGVKSRIASEGRANSARFALMFCMTGLLVLANAPPAWSVVHVGDICRVKGQERNTLQGMGLVVGLQGTGDGDFGPTARGLIQVMRNMGITMAAGQDGAPLELDASNTALVVVTAEVPPHGGRQGDEFGCTVSAVNAESLQGGTLLLTPLLGPSPPPTARQVGPTSGQSPPRSRPEDARVYAVARGPVKLDDPDAPTTGKIAVGCRLEEDFMNPFVKDNTITLVPNRNHARFGVAEEVAFQINNDPEFGGAADDSRPKIARAANPHTIEVTIPEQYISTPVQFAARLLEVRLPVIPNVETVVVNETTGVISMSADLEIAPHALQHESMVVEIAGGTPVGQFSEFNPGGDTSVPTLQALVQSLNSLRVSAEDVIEIIRVLDRAGAIHGHVIYED
ncbi:MAG: flagellar basal body P-ring protein FlgI [Pirellulaceae bacterium]